MIYRMTLPIPKNTPVTNLASVELSVPAGKLVQQTLTFPDGCAGLARVRVVVRERVLWPSNPDQWFLNNDFTHVFGDELDIIGGGEVFRLEGYNLDQIYSHTIYFALTLLPASSLSLSDILLTRPVLASWEG